MLHFLVPLLTVLLTTADTEFTAMAVHDHAVYIGTADGQVWRSDDDGETWTARRIDTSRAIPFRLRRRWVLSLQTPHLPGSYADAIGWPHVLGAPRYLRVHSTWDPGEGFASSSGLDPTGVTDGAGPREMDEIAQRSYLQQELPTESGIPHRLHSALLADDPAVRRIVVHDGAVFAVTDDAVAVSRDDGESWQRASSSPPPKETAPGIVEGRAVVARSGEYAATRHDVWAQSDHGWRARWHGPHRASIVALQKTADGLLVLLSDGLHRLTTPEPWELRGDAIARLRTETEQEPSLDELVYEGLRHDGLLPRQRNKRARARWSHLLPRLRADISMRDWSIGLQQYGLRFGAINPDGSFPLGLEARGPYEDVHWSVIGLWDVQSLVFDAAEIPSDVDDDNREHAEWIRDRITAVYSERRRLMIARAADPQTSLRGAMLRDVRIEELTEQLNLLTNRLVERYADGVRIDAWSRP